MCYCLRRLVQAFCEACDRCDETEAKSIAEMDPGVHNKQDEEGYTGLMCALNGEFGHRRNSLIRWLLSMPDLDTSLSEEWGGWTALHFACEVGLDIDILIGLVRVSSLSTLNMTDSRFDTALDIAVRQERFWGSRSVALYLAWVEGRGVYHRGPLGDDSSDECQERNWKYRKITLQTGIQTDYLQDAMFWAVAANAR